MAQAKKGDEVKVHYTGKLDDGTVFDSSEGREPLQFKIGEGQVIPGFEEGVVGMNTGDTKTISIPSGQAYGPHHDEMVIVVDKSQFPEGMNPELGDQLQMQHPSGQVVLVTVVDVSDKDVTLDANHPLAGKDLTFNVELVDVD
jgi:peptidylprolyl isomerase